MQPPGWHLVCRGNGGASLLDDARIRPWLIEPDVDNLKSSFPARDGSDGELAHASAAVKQLARAGVPILAGTDSPNPGTAHGASMHRELELLVEAGLTPVEALAAATSVPAGEFGLNDRGRIARGKRADLVLVSGDPTKDIFSTRDIVAVWKDGTRVDRSRRGVDSRQAIEKGLISNFEEWLEEMLVELEVGHLFDVSVISGTEGLEKPDPAIFHLALERMQGLLRAQGVWQSGVETAALDAETGLKHALALHYKSVQLNRELKAAELALGDDPSEETFERLRDIQNQITTVDGTEALIEGFGSLSGRATRGF